MTPIDYHNPNDFWRHRQPLGDNDPDYLFMKYVFILVIYVFFMVAAGVLLWFIS